MTKHIAVPDLKPCPFCGGEATVMEAVGDVWVKCCVCHSSNGVSTGDRKKAIDAWNARALLNGPGVEPVAVFAYRRKGLDYFCTCDEDRYNELAQKPNLFEVAVFYTAPSAPVPEWPVLDKPALVGGGRFHVGVSSRLVVEAAQRHYEYEVAPEKEAERIANASKAIDALVAPAQATECDECHGDPSLCDIHDCGDAHKTTAKMQAPVQATPVAYHDKDQPEGIAWCPGYPEKLKDISPLYTSAPVQPISSNTTGE